MRLLITYPQQSFRDRKKHKGVDRVFSHPEMACRMSQLWSTDREGSPDHRLATVAKNGGADRNICPTGPDHAVLTRNRCYPRRTITDVLERVRRHRQHCPASVHHDHQHHPAYGRRVLALRPGPVRRDLQHRLPPVGIQMVRPLAS